MKIPILYLFALSAFDEGFLSTYYPQTVVKLEEAIGFPVGHPFENEILMKLSFFVAMETNKYEKPTNFLK